VVDFLTPLVEKLGGFLHARAPELTVFTVPVSVGFARIEELLYGFVASNPGVEWYFANVYADDGVTPLGWWEAS
jgi:RsiW-degrading membrane proteinase PrsW (M82 family)